MAPPNDSKGGRSQSVKSKHTSTINTTLYVKPDIDNSTKNSVMPRVPKLSGDYLEKI